MKWACCIIVVFLIFLPVVFAAVPNPGDLGVEVLPSVVVNALSKMEDRLAADFREYNDENFKAFDQMMLGYIANYSRSVQQKAIIGILGLNLVVAGLSFYWLNKQNKKLSYESADQRKREGDEDRQYIVENINHIRDRLDYLEQQSRRVDTTVIPTEELDKGYQRKGERLYQEDFDRNLNEFVNSHGGVDDGGRQEETPGDYVEGHSATPEINQQRRAGEIHARSERQREEERFV